jgi:hypothetical protein
MQLSNNPNTVSMNDTFFKKNIKKIILTGAVATGLFFVQHYDLGNKLFQHSSEKLVNQNQNLNSFQTDMTNGKYTSQEIAEIIKNNNDLIQFASHSLIPTIKKGYDLYSDMGESVVFEDPSNGLKITKNDFKTYSIEGGLSPLKQKTIETYLDNQQKKYEKFLTEKFPEKIKEDIIKSVLIYDKISKSKDKLFGYIEEDDQRIMAMVMQLSGITHEETGSYHYNTTVFSPTRAFGRLQMLGGMLGPTAMNDIISKGIPIDQIDISKFEGMSFDKTVHELTKNLEKSSISQNGKVWTEDYRQTQEANVRSYIKRTSYSLSPKSASKTYLNKIQNEDGYTFNDYSKKYLNTKTKQDNMAIRLFVYMQESSHQNLIALSLLEDMNKMAIQSVGKKAGIIEVIGATGLRYNGDNTIIDNHQKMRKEAYAEGVVNTTHQWGNWESGRIAMTTNTAHNYVAASEKYSMEQN